MLATTILETATNHETRRKYIIPKRTTLNRSIMLSDASKPADDLFTIAYDLASELRRNKVTIREFAKRTGITLKRTRELCKLYKTTRIDYTGYCDYHQAITGQNVFSYARYEHIKKIKNNSKLA